MVKKILIVDDEDDVSESVKMLIESQGYEAKSVDNGFDAIKILKKEKFDLVFLDILMPHMSGMKTLEKIRADPKLRNQRVIFLTVVEPSKKGLSVIKSLNPLDYVIKPIENEAFKKKLKKLLSQ